MDVLQQLTKAQENKFKHEQDLLFKAKVKRNRMLGLWAAELMELKAEDTKKYADEFVSLHLKDTGREQLHRKLLDDFSHAGVHRSDHRIERKIHDCMVQAVYDLKNQVGSRDKVSPNTKKSP